jgi:hypothetical protein
MKKLPLTLLIPVAAASLAACNDDPTPRAQARPPGPPRYIGQADLERELGNGFAAGLERLAVMRQPADDATDLGQDLPTGVVEDVSCRTARCTVKWQTASNREKTTRYAVKRFPAGCFAAAADPPLRSIKDVTIASFAEHPLNAIVSVRKGC